MTSLLCSKTRRVLGYFCNNRKYISLFSGYLHVLVIRVVMEGRALKASGLVNFPASAFHKWPCFRLLTTIVILVRGLKLWIRTKRNHRNWDLFAGITKFGSYGDSITSYRRKPPLIFEYDLFFHRLPVALRYVITFWTLSLVKSHNYETYTENTALLLFSSVFYIIFKDTKKMARYKSVEGVFHTKTGRYKLNYENAKRLCALHGAQLATYSQLHKAWQAGAEMCS